MKDKLNEVVEAVERVAEVAVEDVVQGLRELVHKQPHADIQGVEPKVAPAPGPLVTPPDAAQA